MSTNPLLKTLESELGYYRINKIVCPHNPLVDYDRVYGIIYNTYYSANIQCNDIYALMQKLNETVQIIGLEWMTSRGKFTKRLIKAMPELECVAGIIGDEIQRKAYQPTDYTWLLSLTDQIFWDNSGFGNGSSCWWTMYPESRQVFLDNGGVGLLFHNDPNDRYNGIGRTWILPLHEYTPKNGYIDGLFLFNQYGEVDGRDIRLDDTARYMNSVIPDTDAENVRLYNDDDEYTPYINDNSGILIKLKSNPVQKNYEFHLNMGGENSISCYECDDRVSQSDAREYRHRWYCESCYDENFSECDHCGYTYYRSDMTEQDYSIYCSDCFNELFTYCDECNDYYDADSMTNVGYNNYCESCLMDNFTACDTCCELIPNDQSNEYQDGCYCLDCYNELTAEPETT